MDTAAAAGWNDNLTGSQIKPPPLPPMLLLHRTWCFWVINWEITTKLTWIKKSKIIIEKGKREEEKEDDDDD